MNVRASRDKLRTLLRIYVSDHMEAYEIIAPWSCVSDIPESELEGVLSRAWDRFVVPPIRRMSSASERRAIRNRAYEAREMKPRPVRLKRRA